MPRCRQYEANSGVLGAPVNPFADDLDLLDRELVALRNSQLMATRFGELAIQFRELGNDDLADSMTKQREVFVRRISEWRHGQ